MRFREFINEGREDNLRQAMNMLKRVETEDMDGSMQGLLELVDPYVESKEPRYKCAKNYAHLAQLTKFFIEGTKMQTLGEYYKRYMEMPALNVKPIGRFSNFRAFEQEIDRNFVPDERIKPNNRATATGVAQNTGGIGESGAVYVDDKVVVYLGDTKGACIKYGQGSKWGICISRNDGSNLFHSYRWEDKMTTYFVYFKDESINPPSNFIIVDAKPGGSESKYGRIREEGEEEGEMNEEDTYSYNKITPNDDVEIELDALLREFPQMRGALKAGVFKNKVIQGEELAFYQKYYDKKISNFTKLEDQLRFVEMGEEIDDHEWDQLGNIEPILQAYIEGGHDVPPKVLEQYPRHLKRYQGKLKQRVEMNLEDKTLLRDYTGDEVQYMMSYNNIESRHQITLRDALERRIRERAKAGLFPGSVTIPENMCLIPDISDLAITGNLNIGRPGISSLEGCPWRVDGNFTCNNNNLGTLEGAPRIVRGTVDCSNNKLTSLMGGPSTVGGSYKCQHNQLVNLRGFPDKFGGDFVSDISCAHNSLTSLEGAPDKVLGDFNCSSNKLTSLRGGPSTLVGFDYLCNMNNLITLEGAPKEVRRNFKCYNNDLTTLKGAPRLVGGEFICLNNRLTTLEGAPETVGDDFNCAGNKLTSLRGGPKVVGGKFYCGNNPHLTSHEGKPETAKSFIADELKPPSFREHFHRSTSK